MPLGAFATVTVFASPRSSGAIRLGLLLRSAAALGLAAAIVVGLLCMLATALDGGGSPRGNPGRIK